MARTHTVVRGDTLSALAQRFYGDAKFFPIIAAANRIADPNVIRVGQQLVIPDLTRTHVVVRGDTLSALAQRFYGRADLFPIIAAANRIENPNVIRVGQQLVIPDISRTHVVVRGDTLFGLARRFYGRGELFPIIAAANGIANPDLIFVGQLLVIPDLRPGGPADHPTGESPFMLRRTVDLIRLEHDTKLALADDREFELGRVRAWAALPEPPQIPHGNTPASVLESVAGPQAARRAELAGLRSRLDRATANLTAALDLQQPLFGSHCADPIALFPVRLETKWTSDGRRIKVRVYPDDIHIDSFDPALTATELAAARAYWTNPGADAWQQLLTVLSPARAAWATRAARPGAGDPPLRDPEHRHAPRVTTMPARWRFLGLVGGLVVVDVTGADIPDPLPLGLLAADEAAADHDHAAWVVEFDAALAAGMAVELALPDGVDHLDELFVAGVSALSTDDAARRITDTLHGHARTGGLGFLAPGTPTNNTPQRRSAWSSRPTPTPPPDEPAPQPDPVRSDAGRLARALGLTDTAFLTECQGAQRDGDRPVRAISRFAWWGLAFHLVEDLGLFADVEAQARLHIWLDIREHLADYVRGRGPLPTLRTGRQPYGFLPVSTIDEWVPDRPGDADAVIRPWLLRLRQHWRAALVSGWIPRVTDGSPADRVAAEILCRLPVSTDMVIRRVLSANKGQEKFDALNLRAPGPAIAVGGVADGLRWTVPTEDVSNLAWQSDRQPADYALVAQRLSPNAEGYPALFAATGDWLRDACAVLDETMSAADYRDRWPIDEFGQPGLRRPTLLSEPGFVDENTGAPTDFLPHLLGSDNTAPFIGDVEDPFVVAAGVPSTVDRLISQSPEVPREEVERIREFGRRGVPLALELADGLDALAQVPPAEYLPMLFELLDLTSHRLDAWITSLATRRLDRLRADGATGIRIGGYGWVENLRPGTVRASDGFIHAPSLHHAATAAVLRSGYLAHPGDDTLAVDLTSRRARTARWLLGGVRRGQNLGALLGYRFERALHDAHLDELLDRFRRTFPAPVVPRPADEPRPDLWQRSAEAVAAANVLDGMRLARVHAQGAVPALLQERGFAFDDRALPLLDDLADALDAVGDLLLAESVHQLVGGNPMRAGLAADTLGRAEFVPDRFDILRTPHRGRAVTHRIAAVLPADPPRIGGWGADLFADLEPRVEAWIAQLLGPAAEWRLGGTLTVDGQSRRFDITLDQLGSSATGLVLDIAVTKQRRIIARLGELAGVSPAATAGATAEFDTGWARLQAVASRIHRLVSGASALLPAHLVLDAARAAAPDLNETRSRVVAFAQRVATGAQRATLGIDADPARLTALATADPATPGWLSAVTLALADFLGTQVPLTTALSDIPATEQAAQGAAVADVLRRFATIRPTVRAWHETLLLAGARAGRPAPLSAVQLPAGGPWIGAAFGTEDRPRARQHLVRHTPFGPVEGQPFAGLVFDEWVEVLPGSDALAGTGSELTGLSFHFDRPDAKAPQAVLLAVPPDMRRGWTADDLALVLRDTLELAKLRAVDLGDLPLLDDIAPTVRLDGLGQRHGAMVSEFWRDLAEE